MWISRSILVFAGFVAAAAAAELSVKTAEKSAPPGVDKSISAVLQNKSVQAVSGDKPVYEFWLAKELPLTTKPDSAAKALDQLKTATLLGVVSVPSASRDYRDDEIPAGVYTMRFVLQPQDGNHLGTSEFLYFAALTPAKLDTKLDGITNYKQLVQVSSKETSTDHPIILSLRPPSGDAGDTPKIVEPAAEHKSVLVTVPARAGSEATRVAFEIVVEGKGHK